LAVTAACGNSVLAPSPYVVEAPECGVAVTFSSRYIARNARAVDGPKVDIAVETSVDRVDPAPAAMFESLKCGTHYDDLDGEGLQALLRRSLPAELAGAAALAPIASPLGQGYEAGFDGPTGDPVLPRQYVRRAMHYDPQRSVLAVVEATVFTSDTAPPDDERAAEQALFLASIVRIPKTATRGPAAGDSLIDALARRDTVFACPPTGAALRGADEPLTCRCDDPPAADTRIWGTDVYLGGSPLCLAARHAGKIGPEGGTVTVQWSGPQGGFVGSTRNGVTTGEYGPFDTSFRFAGQWQPTLQ
jgi:hypothetical protein